MIRRSSLLAALLLWAAPVRAQPTPLTIFAAASLQDGLRALEGQWRATGGAPLRLSYAASSALARQIEQGAPADLFMSADEPWMNYLAERGLILRESRISPLGNALVLVAPPGSAIAPQTLTRDTDLAALLGQGRLATGDPAHVPVGRYAQAALQWMGQWQAIGPRIARADNVRAALLLVEWGEAPLGIVYATDARAASLRVIGSFPAESHPPVSYPFAITRRAAGNEQAAALLAFLTGPAAMPTWQRLGFTRPAE